MGPQKLLSRYTLKHLPEQGSTAIQFVKHRTNKIYMGNISAHQNMSRNMISAFVFILISNYADSKFVLYLCIGFKY